jgi:prepilin-type N-terminal cleavage/methylation domain-containing protein
MNQTGRAGFTLIELLVALAILGGIMAIAVPSMVKFYDRLSFSLAREDVEREITGLGSRARAEGRSLVLRTWPDVQNADNRPLISLPKGWSIEVEPPIAYRFDGLCLGGHMVIVVDQQRFTYHLDPPFCRPILDG